MTGKGQRKSLWSLFNANTKSSTWATRFRSRHNQPMSSKPSCAEKHPRSRSRTCSRRWRAWRQSIMSIYMFSAHSPSRLLGQNSGGTETFACYGYRSENTKSSSSLYLCVSVPFSRGSRRHTEGLLEVELAHTDGVCRLWQADAAISEELKTSSWAGFLSRKKQRLLVQSTKIFQAF